MKASIALGSTALGLAYLIAPALAQSTNAPVPLVPPPPPTIIPPALSAPVMDLSAPPATGLGSIWNTDANGRDYRFYSNVGLNYMWVHGGNPIPSGPMTGASFSAGVINNRGLGVGVSGSELYQSTTRESFREVPHKP